MTAPARRAAPWSLLVVLLALLARPAAAAPTLGRTDPNGGRFPDSSLVDARFLLDAPAGKHGFLTVSKDGHFVWADGRRARFWGVNISNQSVFVSRPEVDRVVDVLARAGTNMVRFEALDSAGGLLDVAGRADTRSIDPARLAALDYWVAKLRERGIYYYLDLLDFRQFREGDEVPAAGDLGRAAKPYAFFDRRLIDLQKEFAQQLLTHRNPHTALRYVDDPALALVELCNEHGLFMRAAGLDSLVEPYATGLRQQWNRWLMQQYGSRDGIKAAWGRLQSADVLGPTEDPAAYSVLLPLFSAAPGGQSPDASTVDIRRAATRLRDGVRFLYETQRGYFREMRAALRDMGLKVPVTGVVSNEIVPDVASVAAELDFTSENYYSDHPAFDGKDWQGAFFYSDTNPLRDSSPWKLAPWLAALRWQNKPVVVREWATVWPNRYRAVGVPEMAAYAALQDFDAVLLFGYQVTRRPDSLSDFDHQADPTVWGLYALGAAAFLRGEVRPSPYSATIEYTPDRLYRWPNTITGLHRLAWFTRLNSRMAPARPTRSSPRAGARPTNELVLRPTDSLESALDRLQKMGASVSKRQLGTGALRSSTGQIVRRTGEGLLRLETPRTVALCGDLPANRPIDLGPFRLVLPTRIGALMAVSLDGKPLKTSDRYVVKMVSRAENTGQALAPAKNGAPGPFRLKEWGKPPVRTFGRSSDAVLRLLRGGRAILSLALEDGTWELLVRGEQATLVCDTAGVRGRLFDRPITTVAGTPMTAETTPPAALRAGPRQAAR